LKAFYLVLAIVGAIVPLAFFAQFFGAGQVDFISALFVNGAAGGFSADLFISSFVFWAYIWSKRANGPNMWTFVALNLLIGLSCALPAYLYAQELRRPPRGEGS
jgi:hypothetical protein